MVPQICSDNPESTATSICSVEECLKLKVVGSVLKYTVLYFEDYSSGKY
jgi:hypothetical protein